MELKKTIINGVAEECDCENCGMPMYNGEEVYWIDEMPYCLDCFRENLFKTLMKKGGAL